MTEVEKLSQNQDTDAPEPSSFDLRKLVRQQLQSLQRAGLSHLPVGSGTLEVEFTDSDSLNSSSPTPQSTSDRVADPLPQSRASEAQRPVSNQTAPLQKPPAAAANSATTLTSLGNAGQYGEHLPESDRRSALNVLQEQVAGCTNCSELSSQRTQTVFGVGNPLARLVFVGEGPGAQEDRQGIPFVGEAGQLLDKIIGACKLSRDEVYILNTVKCRPPGNRNPSQTELANCWGFAEQQLQIIQPEFICCLGSVASRTLLKTTQSLGRLRRQFHSYQGSKVLVTYHPAYLLRTPSAKRHVWEDMKLLMKEMGIDLSM